MIFGRKISMNALIFNLVFALRALVVCHALVFGVDWPFPFQILAILGSTSLLLGVACHAGNKLWIDRLIHLQYVTNEFMVCVAATSHFCFTEFVDNYAFRVQLGSIFIMMVILIVFVNFGFIFVQIYRGVKDKIRQRRDRLERERKLLEKMSATEYPLLKTTHTINMDDSEKKNLGNWLDAPLKSSGNDEELSVTDQLALTLHRKNKSSRVAPVPLPIEEYGSEQEGSLYSYRPEEDNGENHE